MININLKRDLLAMAGEDQRVRNELAVTSELFSGYAPLMAELHQRNAQKLNAIVEQVGWPGRSLVGQEGADAAWLVLLHAIGYPALQRKCLPLIKASAAAGETGMAQVAYLEDRINIMSGCPQRYGTQFDWDENGLLNPCPIQEPDRVDEYRESVGLPPLAQVTEQLRNRAASEGELPPPDHRKRRQDMEAWARLVGWI